MSSELEQVHQRLFVKDQEINALKVQNRHLIAKVEETEARAKPNQINTQQITAEVHRLIQRSLTQAFEAMQGTLRGVYQQSLRSQQAVEDLATHSRELENRVAESRKEDQSFYQDKIFQTLNTLCDRIERTIDQRLAALSNIDVIVKKQNEALHDLEAVKLAMSATHRNSESSDEQLRNIAQKINHHRTEFKLLRGEVRAAISQNSSSQNPPSLDSQMDDALNIELGGADAVDSNANSDSGNDKKEDLTLILDLLRTQKQDLQDSSSKAEAYLKKYRAENSGNDIQEVKIDSSVNEGNP